MRAIVDAEAFSEALSNVSKVIQKSSIPVLEGLLIRMENGRCSLTGTDFSTWLTVELPVKGEDFAFVLQTPQEVVKACRHYRGELTLEMHGMKSEHLFVTLTNGRRSGIFNAFPEEDYPARPEAEDGVSFTVNAAALLKRIDRVKYAVREPKGFSERAYHTCVQFSGNDVFCLDGYRAACDTDTVLAFPKSFLAWGKSLAFLKLMGNSEASVQIGVHNIWLTSDNVIICCKREGVETFPLCDAVPKRFQEEFYVSPRAFLRELEYLESFQPKRSRFTAVFCGGRLYFDMAESRCSTSVELEGESEIPVGFDQRFMKDALSQFREEPRVRMKLSGGVSPIIIEAEERNDFALILPCKLHGTMAA